MRKLEVFLPDDFKIVLTSDGYLLPTSVVGMRISAPIKNLPAVMPLEAKPGDLEIISDSLRRG